MTIQIEEVACDSEEFFAFHSFHPLHGNAKPWKPKAYEWPIPGLLALRPHVRAEWHRKCSIYLRTRWAEWWIGDNNDQNAITIIHSFKMFYINTYDVILTNWCLPLSYVSRSKPITCQYLPCSKWDGQFVSIKLEDNCNPQRIKLSSWWVSMPSTDLQLLKGSSINVATVYTPSPYGTGCKPQCDPVYLDFRVGSGCAHCS